MFRDQLFLRACIVIGSLVGILYILVQIWPQLVASYITFRIPEQVDKPTSTILLSTFLAVFGPLTFAAIRRARIGQRDIWHSVYYIAVGGIFGIGWIDTLIDLAVLGNAKSANAFYYNGVFFVHLSQLFTGLACFGMVEVMLHRRVSPRLEGFIMGMIKSN